MKKCVHCLKEKPVTEFHIKRDGSVGSRCLHCRGILNRSQTVFRQKNRERLAAEMRRYRFLNLQTVRETSRKSYFNNWENAQIHKKNRKAKLRLLRESSCRPLSSQEWSDIKKNQGGRCFYCGKVADLTLDHCIPLSKGGGHVKENIVGCCKNCNSRKKDLMPDDFIKRLEEYNEFNK